MLCLGISGQEIENALIKAKTTFSTAADRPERCVNALEVAVNTLAKVRKNGKRTLNKAKNLSLKKEFEDAYNELKQLQEYSGSDKIPKCLEVARKWRWR